MEPNAPSTPWTVEELQSQVDRQQHLLDASYALHTTLDLDELLGLILAAASKGVRADRGTVFLVSDDGTQIWSRVLQGDENLTIKLPIGKGIAGTVAQTGEVINIVDAHEDERFDSSWDKKTGFRTRQILCAPIKRRDGVIVGVFQLLNKAAGDFDANDEGFLEALSVPAALAIENARLHRKALEQERQSREIALAQNVQRAFQPEHKSAELGPIIAAGMNELCEDASGDYYDCIELPSGRLGVVVGDVSGHGLGSSLVMAQARAFLRAFSLTCDTVAEVINMLNDALAADMTSGNFMTMFYAVVDPKDGSMEWCSAGHPPTMLKRGDGRDTEKLEAIGPVLGVIPGVGYTDGGKTELAVGDTLLIYTDGANEAVNPEGEQFGYHRLQETFEAASDQPPKVILERIRQALLDWTRAPDCGDDLTMVVVQKRPEG